MRTAIADLWHSVGVWLLVLGGQRLFSVLLLRPGGYFYDYSDYHTYWQYARLYAEGFVPFRDFWMEYPPLFPLWNQAVYVFSLHFTPFPDFRFWHHLLLALTFLPFDLGVLVLLYRIAVRVWDHRRAGWVAAVWVLLFAPLFVFQGYFDILPLFGLLFAVWAMLAYRPAWTGVGLAFGFLTKLLGVLALPAAVWVFAARLQADTLLTSPLPTMRAFFTRANCRMIGVFALLCLLVLAPFFIIGPEWIAITLRNFAGRGSWQTVWALIDGYYGYGLVQGDRFNPGPVFDTTPSRIPWLWVNLAFAALGLWLWTRRWHWMNPRIPVAFTALVVFLFFLWSKGWSPQFTLMLLPWLLLLFPDWRGIVFALLFTAFMIADNLYFSFWLYRSDNLTPLFVLVIARTALLLIVTVLTYRRLVEWNHPASVN